MSSRADANTVQRRSVERHYDSLALLYRVLWGEHIHHGLWLTEGLPPKQAQERLTAYLADRACISASDRVLDVGCGYGASARWLYGRIGCSVTGITASRRQARYAQRRRELSRRDPGPTIARADAAALPFAGGTFDVVWVIECIEHLADKASFVAEVARLLHVGGRFALCTWQRGPGVDAADPLLREVCEAFLCPSLAEADEYRNWCAAVGLTIRHEEDLTERVRPTWRILQSRVSQPWLAPIRWLLGDKHQRFVTGFSTIDEAYASGAMRYGILVAEKSYGKVRALSR